MYIHVDEGTNFINIREWRDWRLWRADIVIHEHVNLCLGEDRNANPLIRKCKPSMSIIFVVSMFTQPVAPLAA